MVGEHGVSQAVDSEDTGEELQALPNPLTTGLKRFPYDSVLSAEESQALLTQRRFTKCRIWTSLAKTYSPRACLGISLLSS